MSWLNLITSLPTDTATVRMRVWRSLKASGVAVLKDGVYLLPNQPDCRLVLEQAARDVLEAGGSAFVLQVQAPADTDFVPLFDRSADHAALLAELPAVQALLAAGDVGQATRQCRKLRKTQAAIAATDYFPGESQRQVERALLDLEASIARASALGEPSTGTTAITVRKRADYLGRTWATRARPWVDRLACAWLIRRHIDPRARILWLAHPQDCPPDALGFDFDGATFSHTEGRVSFEVLLASFGLQTPALDRLGALVHFLDVGGVQPPEALGVESVLAGLRDSLTDDDTLLQAACTVLDGLLRHFESPAPHA